MNNNNNKKKWKRLVGCVSAVAMLFGSIPMGTLVATAEETTEDTTTTTYYDMSEEAYKEYLHGVNYDATNGLYVRMPLDTAASISGIDDTAAYLENEITYMDGSQQKLDSTVYSHVREVAGGRIRFSTDSATISIDATLQHRAADYADSMGAGKYGFDVYEETQVDGETVSTYIGTLSPETTPTATGTVEVKDSLSLGDAGTTRNLTIYFPITTETTSVKIGLDADSTIGAHGLAYTDSTNRILFYGSSITQGGAVSKPGNTYVNTVGRNLNRDYLNLGVWGSCHAETEFAKYMVSNLTNISAFVYDYDHNNSQATKLEATHYPFYEIIRNGYTDADGNQVAGFGDEIPIIMITRPGKSIEDTATNSTVAEMKAVIYDSYLKAKAAGHKNVHFIDGEVFFGYAEAFFTDGVHPNDAGQAKMAKVVTVVLERALAGEENLCVTPANCDTILLEEDFEGGISLKDGTDGSTGEWEISQKNITNTTFDLQDGSSAGATIKYTRTAGTDGYGGASYIADKTILQGSSKYVIEMDTTLYKSEKTESWSHLELSLRDTSAEKLDIRVEPRTEGKLGVIIYEKTDGTNTVRTAEQISDVKYKEVLNNNEAKYDCKLRFVVEHITNSDGSTSLAITVYVNDSRTGFIITPNESTWQAKFFNLYMYGGSESDTVDDVYQADIDYINIYDMAHALELKEEVSATTVNTGTEAHWECTKCAKKFMDEATIFETTVADVTIPTKCYLVNETFDGETTNFKTPVASSSPVFDDNSVNFSMSESEYVMQATQTGKGFPYAYTEYDGGILSGYSDYVVELDDVKIYKTTLGKWPSLGVMFRQRKDDATSTPAKTLEFRLEASKAGLNIVPYYDGTKYSKVDETTTDDAYEDAGYANMTGQDLVTMYSNGQYSFNLRVVVDGMGTDSITCKFIIGTEEKTIAIPSEFDFAPTGLRLYLNGSNNTSNSTTLHKASVGDVRVTTDSHKIRTVAATPSDDTTPGLKAHYKCATCGAKFSDAAGITKVTDEDLAYKTLKEVLYQTRANKENPSNKDIRFVTYVDDYNKYSGVKFTLTSNSKGKTNSATTTTVYSAIYANDELRTTSDVYGREGEYFATFVLKNCTDDILSSGLEVTVEWIPIEGEARERGSRSITYAELKK